MPWKAVLVAASQTTPRAWGAAMEPWQRVLLKQPGAVPAGAGLAGWPAGLADAPGKWHWAQTGALEASVVAWFEPAALCQGLAGWGAATPWQLVQALLVPSEASRPEAKLVPWQTWQEARPPPVGPCAIFARAPWLGPSA